MKNIFLLFLLVLIAGACKKEKKIEKNLWKNGGEWEIKTFEESYYTVPSSQNDGAFTIHNGGTIHFKKDGSGKFNYSDELAEYLEDIFYEEQINANFDYYFTEEAIYFIFDNVEGIHYDFEWEKDKITLKITEESVHYDYDQNNDPIPGSKETSTYTLQFECEKK